MVEILGQECKPTARPLPT